MMREEAKNFLLIKMPLKLLGVLSSHAKGEGAGRWRK